MSLTLFYAFSMMRHEGVKYKRPAWWAEAVVLSFIRRVGDDGDDVIADHMIEARQYSTSVWRLLAGTCIATLYPNSKLSSTSAAAVELVSNALQELWPKYYGCRSTVRAS